MGRLPLFTLIHYVATTSILAATIGVQGEPYWQQSWHKRQLLYAHLEYKPCACIYRERVASTTAAVSSSSSSSSNSI